MALNDFAEEIKIEDVKPEARSFVLKYNRLYSSAKEQEEHIKCLQANLESSQAEVNKLTTQLNEKEKLLNSGYNDIYYMTVCALGEIVGIKSTDYLSGNAFATAVRTAIETRISTNENYIKSLKKTLDEYNEKTKTSDKVKTVADSDDGLLRPIDVASKIIRKAPKENTKYLRELAEHLLVYCNAQEE